MTIIFGTHGADTLTAASKNDVLFGLSGFDTLESTFSQASMFGGWGWDTLTVDYDQNVNDPVQDAYDWMLFGDQGNDTLMLDVRFRDSFSGGDSPSPVLQSVLGSGVGDDIISVNIGSSIHDFRTLTIKTAIIDTDGDNTIILDSAGRLELGVVTAIGRILMGDGNDNITISALSHSLHIADGGISDYQIELGNGHNILLSNQSAQNTSWLVLGGNGIDELDMVFSSGGLNTFSASTDLHLDLREGDDFVDLSFEGTLELEVSHTDVVANLGAGNNEFSVKSVRAGNFDVRAEDGNDIVTIQSDSFWGLDPAPSINLDLGDGQNTILLDWGILSFSPRSEVATANIVTGAGADTIQVMSNFRSSGWDFSNTADQEISITSGAGPDEITLDQSLFQGDAYSEGTTIQLEDFSPDDGDILKLTGFSIGRPDGYTIAAHQDILSLSALYPWLAALDQVGPDAVLSVNGGGSEPGKIVFVGLDFGIANDPPQDFRGTNASDVFVGGDNNDAFFLRRHGDTATGNEGADLFRVNAAPSHVLDGDAYVITDLNFAEGDVLRFDQFGPDWADDTLDPGNQLHYATDPNGSTFNNWIVDSVEDLAELEASGAVTLSALSGGTGTQLEFQNRAGGSATMDLLGVFVGSGPGGSASPNDPPQSFVGNNTSNVFVGGDNDDAFFLRRFDDTATGNEGADLFRVNAVSPHVLDGDNHVITDLDFAEGDILRFDQFGAAWADDSVDPANTLQFVSDPSGFDNWIVDSVEDLTELEGSGALVLSALSGGAGTRLEFQDLAGDTATIDLWNVFA